VKLKIEFWTSGTVGEHRLLFFASFSGDTNVLMNDYIEHLLSEINLID